MNDGKTRIVAIEDFVNSYLSDPEEEEERRKLHTIREQIQHVFDLIGDYQRDEERDSVEDFLDDEELKMAVRENLRELFDECLTDERFSQGIARHLLRRASGLRTNVLSDSVFGNLERLAPVFREVSKYLTRTKKASRDRGNEFVDFLVQHPFGQLDFCRLWGLHTLCTIDGMATEAQLWMLAETCKRFQTRMMACVARFTNNVDWVREHKEDWASLGPWDRRALIYSSSILPKDERRPWLGVVQDGGDFLDAAVARLVR